MTQPEPHHHTPLIIALSGGRGGVGRSTLALALALTAARRGLDTLLVDADTAAPSLHLPLGVLPPTPPDHDGISNPEQPLDPFLQATHTPHLDLLLLATARRFPFVRPRLDVPALLGHLRSLPHRLILLDLPPGFDPVFAALFALCDLPLLVTTPHRAALHAATQTLRAATFHALGFHPDCFTAEDELLFLMRTLPLHFNRADLLADHLSPNTHRIVTDTLDRIVPEIVLNRARLPEDLHLPPALAVAWRHLLGLHGRPLAAIPHLPEDDLLDPAHTLAPFIEPILHAALHPHLRAQTLPRPARAPNTPYGIAGLPDAAPPSAVFDAIESIQRGLQHPAKPLALLSQIDAWSLLQSLDHAIQDASADAPDAPPRHPSLHNPPNHRPNPPSAPLNPSPMTCLRTSTSPTPPPHHPRRPTPPPKTTTQASKRSPWRPSTTRAIDRPASSAHPASSSNSSAKNTASLCES